MTVLPLTAIAALVLVNGFFVAAEFALVSVRRGQLAANSLAARTARRQQEKLDEYLAACQLGITIASLALGALGEPTIAHLLEPLFGSLATAGPVASFCAIPLEVFHRALRPLVVVLNNASNGIVRAFGGTPATSHAQTASLEELRQLIGGLTEDGQIDRTEAQILHGIFTLDERRASDVMTPRTRVIALHPGESAREALERTRDQGHSRFPLLDHSGELLGVVFGRELTAALLDGEDDRAVETLRRDVLIVPPTTPLDVLLARLQSERATISAVVDEYGQLDGIVTIEDILEEVVGEIWDEDDLASGIRPLADGRIVCRGDTSLRDLESYGVDVAPARIQASTIGGAIQELLGRLPRIGDSVQFGSLAARVLSVEAGRIKRVVLTIAAGVTPGRL